MFPKKKWGGRMKQIEVVGAIIIEGKKVFCTQRNGEGSLAYKWEFPGGKVEPGETHEAALIREMKEELNTTIRVLEPFMTVHHQYDHFSITLHTYICEVVSGELELLEHHASSWASREEILILDWAEADGPIVRKLYDYLGQVEGLRRGLNDI